MAKLPALRAVLGPVALVATAACAAWHPAQGDPREIIAGQHPEQIRVTTSDSASIVVRDPVVSGDTISGEGERCGWVDGGPERACSRGHVSIPVDRIAHMELGGISASRSVTAATVTVVVLAMIVGSLSFFSGFVFSS